MKKYRLTSPLVKGEIFMTYKDGYLTGVEFVLAEPLNYDQFGYFFKHVSYHEQFLLQHGMGKMTVEEMIVEASNVKIAKFCDAYLKYKGIKYKVSASDAGKIGLIEFSQELLDFYFRSQDFMWNGKQSISNLVKYYNEVRSQYTASLHQKAGNAHKKAVIHLPVSEENRNKFNKKNLNSKV